MSRLDRDFITEEMIRMESRLGKSIRKLSPRLSQPVIIPQCAAAIYSTSELKARKHSIQSFSGFLI